MLYWNVCNTSDNHAYRTQSTHKGISFCLQESPSDLSGVKHLMVSSDIIRIHLYSDPAQISQCHESIKKKSRLLFVYSIPIR